MNAARTCENSWRKCSKSFERVVRLGDLNIVDNLVLLYRKDDRKSGRCRWENYDCFSVSIFSTFSRFLTELLDVYDVGIIKNL